MYFVVLNGNNDIPLMFSEQCIIHFRLRSSLLLFSRWLRIIMIMVITTLTGMTGDAVKFSSYDFDPAVPPLTGSVKRFFNMSGLSFLHM